MRRAIAGIIVALSCVLIPFGSVVHASTLTLHGRFVDSTLHVEYLFTKAVILPHGTSDWTPPKGGSIVLIYATVRNMAKGGSYYQMVDFVGAASPHGRGFKFIPSAQKYQPALTGNLLNQGQHQSGWFGYAVPAGVKIIFIRFSNAGTSGGSMPATKVILRH